MTEAQPAQPSPRVWRPEFLGKSWYHDISMASPLEGWVKFQKKMLKGGCWDIPAFIVGCYGFYVIVQWFFLTFDVLCGGDCGTILSRTFTSLFGFRWGGELFRLIGILFVFGFYLRFFNISHFQLSSIHFNRLVTASSSPWASTESTADLIVGRSVEWGDDVIEPSLFSHRGHFEWTFDRTSWIELDVPVEIQWLVCPSWQPFITHGPHGHMPWCNLAATLQYSQLS